MTWLKDSLVTVTPYVKFCSNQPASNDSQYKVYLQFKPILMTTVTYACPWPHMVVVCLIVVLDTRQPIRYRYGDTPHMQLDSKLLILIVYLPVIS